MSFKENTIRNARLFETLLEGGNLFDEALGYLKEHSEESYGIGFEEAIDLAKQYDQYAIFNQSSNSVGYYECANTQVITKRDIL